MAKAYIEVIDYEGVACINYDYVRGHPEFSNIDAAILTGYNIEAIPVDMIKNKDWVWLANNAQQGGSLGLDKGLGWMKWTRFGYKKPEDGQKVLLFANGVVQEDIYMFNAECKSHSNGFWHRGGSEKYVASPDHYWMPLPDKPDV